MLRGGSSVYWRGDNKKEDKERPGGRQMVADGVKEWVDGKRCYELELAGA